MKMPSAKILSLAARGALPLPGTGNDPGRLQEITAFGANPGELRAFSYVPPGLPAGAPLVVVLHGCTQHAAGYDIAAGWSGLADEQGFALLFPEQQRANNYNLCFNWFSPIDSRRGSGEALSIRQMIAWLTQTHKLDPGRVFVTGLSAGGAMTSIMLATYPEVFAGGAIIAGLPFGAAASVSDAFSRMAGQGYPAETELGALVRHASPGKGPWPKLSVWHGSADTTVDPSNADRIIAQWRAVHGLRGAFTTGHQSGAHIRRVWCDDAGHAMLEQHIITGMGHGTPLNTRGADGVGKAGPFMLEVGVSSTRDIAQFWGLSGRDVGQIAPHQPLKSVVRVPPAASAIPPVAANAARAAPASRAGKGLGEVIEGALRAAGLMK